MAEINTWPGWQCVRHLGTGSFGKVYEIQRIEEGKSYKAALKVITIPQNDTEIENAYYSGMNEEEVTQYFHSLVSDVMNEISLMSDLKGYTNIVSYEDHQVLAHRGEIGWDILIRMELLSPLLKWTAEHPMSEEDVINLGCDMCRALELCHKNKIIHRDIKPQNIFVNKNGDFKLGDFGIARVVEKTNSSMSQKGTYTYMAPEIFKGMKYDATVDIYSLGIVLYRFLNYNRTPFLPLGAMSYEDPVKAQERRMAGEPIPAPAMGSVRLKRIVLKMLQYDPKNRIQSASELRRMLEMCRAEFESTREDGYIFSEPSDVDMERNMPVMPDVERARTIPVVPVGQNVENGAAVYIKNKPINSKPEKKIKGKVFLAAVCAVIVLICILFCFIKLNDIVMSKDAENNGNDIAAEKNDQEQVDEDKDDPKGSDKKDVTNPTEYSYNNVNVGDIITFGSYEQDNDETNGKEAIEWQVLEKEGTKVLVISKYGLDCQPYNTEYEEVTWESCTLRTWLNDEFINVAFTDAEKAMISTVTVMADENPYYDTDPGNDTWDRIFLLSMEESEKYFNSDAARECIPTAYAEAQGAYVSNYSIYVGNCWWWMRSPGAYPYVAALVSTKGGIYEDGTDVNVLNIAVRPAMLIDLEP